MERLYTTRELTEWFGVTRQAILNWRRAGKLESTHLGGVIRYKESQVQAFLAKSGAAYRGKGQGTGA